MGKSVTYNKKMTFFQKRRWNKIRKKCIDSKEHFWVEMDRIEHSIGPSRTVKEACMVCDTKRNTISTPLGISMYWDIPEKCWE